MDFKHNWFNLNNNNKQYLYNMYNNIIYKY